MVPWVSLQCVIVVFPDHTHLLFYVVVLLISDENMQQCLSLAGRTVAHLWVLFILLANFVGVYCFHVVSQSVHASFHLCDCLQLCVFANYFEISSFDFSEIFHSHVTLNETSYKQSSFMANVIESGQRSHMLKLCLFHIS